MINSRAVTSKRREVLNYIFTHPPTHIRPNDPASVWSIVSTLDTATPARPTRSPFRGHTHIYTHIHTHIYYTHTSTNNRHTHTYTYKKGHKCKPTTPFETRTELSDPTPLLSYTLTRLSLKEIKKNNVPSRRLARQKNFAQPLRIFQSVYILFR